MAAGRAFVWRWRLAALPHRAVRLSHDIPAGAALLGKVADTAS
ncbi:hypothetical protein [Streptomyces sp. NPDC058280]